MSPVNPTGSAFSISVGAAAIPDSATFERLSIGVRGGRLLKFMVMHMHTDRPAVYFSNANSTPSHFQILGDLGIAHEPGMFRGSLSYYPKIAAPDGSLGLFYFDMLLGYEQQDGLDGLEDVRRVYALLAANMDVLDDNLAYRIPNSWLSDLRPHLSSFQDSRVNLLYDDEEFPEAPFISLNPGEGYGLLRNMDPDERPRQRDIVIYESLPNELPRVAGIISTVPQTPLSHVNLRAAQNSIPNAYISDALSDSKISALLDSHVFYRVTEQGWEMRAATLAEVNDHYESSRPAEVQRLRRVLTPTTTVSPLSSIGFQHCEEYGVKASNLAVLGTLVLSPERVPGGFAIPFYFYDEFMKHNGFYEQVEEMLADPDFQSSQDEQVKQLKKLRKKIKDGDSPAWIISALTAMHDTYPEGQSLRYRSSTNNEDLPGFNGAGLYDSKTQKASETEDDGIDKSLKEVYASLWNYRAFAGREFQRIDHLTVAMGVLVHPNFKNELVNGVAVSADPAFGTSGNHYVNSQVGEDLVTNPEADSLPEEILLRDGGAYHVISLSSLAKPGELLLSNTQLSQLRDDLEQFHSHFSSLYNAGTADPFAMEIEFKITSENILSIKQARPWIFTPPSTATPPDTTDADALTASLVSPPSQHDGKVFNLRIDFSHPIRNRHVDVKDYALEVSGGTVTGATRVDGRSDQWKVVVTPDSNANVQIVLPARRPCSIAGAICTRDGLRLSNRLELTVVGPDGGGTIDRDAGERTPCSGTNESPQANNDLAATTRDEAVLIDVLSNDTDPNSHALIITEVSSPTKGTAALTAQNMINYTPAPDTDGTDSFSYTVSDGEHSSTATVTVTVTVNERPAIVGDAEASIEEGETLLVGTYRAADPENALIAWQPLAGADGDRFEFTASNGRLVFKAAPDYEDAADSGGDNVYDVTLGVSAGGHTTTFDVAVSVTNKEEDGALGLSSTQPQADADYTATLSDPDEVSSTDWAWERSTSRNGPWAAVSGATDGVTTSVYRPGAGDVGYFLRVSAAYIDGHGPDKSRSVVSANSVKAAPVANVAPSFEDRAPTRSVRENARARAAVGAAVTATDSDSGDVVTYELSGSDLFTINSNSGQISVVADGSLDHETVPSHSVTVKASDTSNASDTVTVTITVTSGTTRPPITRTGPGPGGGGGGGDFDVGVATFVVANGWSAADVGVAAVLAARTDGAVVVYTAGDELSAETAMLLREASPAEVVIVGGTAAVSRDVRTQIRAASSESGISRVTGADRADTAAGTARRILGVPSQAGRVTLIVANGWSPPDIGAAAALAARSGRSAVIYTQADRLPEVSAALLRDYQVARVVLIGGTAAISDEVRDGIAAAAGEASISRLTGVDRVDTAAQTARRVLGNPASAPDGITLVIANGWSAPDVGVAAALAAATENAAVAYTTQGSLPAATAALIRDYRPDQIIIVGGRAAVANDVRAAITEAAPSSADVRRITGTTRTDTAARAARRILGSP